MLKRVKAEYSQPCLGLPAMFSGWWFTVPFRWWRDSQNHRWPRLAETMGVHLVHTSAQVGPPKASCPCPDDFCVSLRMETLQPPKQPVLLLSHSHSKKIKNKKSFLTFIEKFPYSHLCHCLDLPVVEGLRRTRQKTSFLLSISLSLYVLTCMQIESPGDAHYSGFPMSASLKQVGPYSKTKVHKLHIKSVPLSLSVAFEQLWKICRVLPCGDLAVLEIRLWCAAGPCVL